MPSRASLLLRTRRNVESQHLEVEALRRSVSIISRSVLAISTHGRVEAIYTAPEAKAPVVRVAEVEAEEGRGLSGDRYAEATGAFSRFSGVRREVSLISAEAIRTAENEAGVHLSAGEHRRNVVVRDVDLLALIGREFAVGDAVMKGVQVCAPCGYLSKIQGQPGLRDALKGRGGIRAQVVKSGVIREGDQIFPVDISEVQSLP